MQVIASMTANTSGPASTADVMLSCGNSAATTQGALVALQEDADALDQMQAEKETIELENAEVIRQMEEDTDQEIEELKIMCDPLQCSFAHHAALLLLEHVLRNLPVLLHINWTPSLLGVSWQCSDAIR